ncbi:ShlB/FhaC/HecB family hemolysin secretion/activation protein, partial [Variovorax sp. LjRoot178]
IYRDQRRKTTLGLRGFRRSARNFINDTEIEVQRRVTGGWELGLAHREFIGQATLDANLAYRRGTGAFGALPAPEEAFGEGTSRFRLVSAELGLNGATLWPSLFVNTGGAVVTSAINNNPSGSTGSIAGAAFGTAIGYPLGAAVQSGLNGYLNHWARPMWQEMGLTIQRWVGPSPVPGAVGSAFGSIGQEVGNALVNNPSTPINAGNPTRGGR